ncbi:MAG: hypothetical protein KIT84_05415 [Labilithrix sp.]|nr:hypothetical protein [Labilithrix sp.]MCW5810426.1 hypothetical protein [Labilithrix sp.]
MPAPSPIDHYALFDDVVAVAKNAHGATAGWRAICVRAQRTVGKKVASPLAALDLDEEIAPLGVRVRVIAAHAPIEVDTLVFGLFDGVDDDGSGVYTGFHLMGTTGIDHGARWLTKTPTWRPKDRFLSSPSLDAIVRAGNETRGEPKKAVAHALRFGAAALLARFAAEGLHQRIVVAFDDGDFAEVRAPLKL